jgi:hypothetical protein
MMCFDHTPWFHILSSSYVFMYEKFFVCKTHSLYPVLMRVRDCVCMYMFVQDFCTLYAYCVLVCLYSCVYVCCVCLFVALCPRTYTRCLCVCACSYSCVPWIALFVYTCVYVSAYACFALRVYRPRSGVCIKKSFRYVIYVHICLHSNVHTCILSIWTHCVYRATGKPGPMGVPGQVGQVST